MIQFATRPITEEERAMLNDSHPLDDMCDCPSCKGTRRRNEAIEFLNEQDDDDDCDDYYRFNGFGFDKM
jgi:hypothetical protein